MKRTKKIFFITCYIVFIFAGLKNVWAQQNNNYKILGISVTGNVTADASFIKSTSGLVIGSKITGDDIQNAIKQLWGLDMFSDISVELDREVGNEIYLKILVEEYPRLNKIELSGNKKVKRKDIDKNLTFYKGQVISHRDVARVRRSLKKLYEDKGYLLAEITPAIVPTNEKGRVNLKVIISEGNKVQVKKIHFHGNASFSDKKLRNQMKQIKEDGWLRGADFDETEFDQDLQLVINFYRSEGFRDIEILRDSLSYGPEKKDMFVDIWVHEGQQYVIGEITWEGNELYSESVLENQLGFIEGDVYSSKKIQEAVVGHIGSKYYDAGYIYATVNPVERPKGKNVVDLHFLVTEGDAVKINKIMIAGNTKTKEKVIRRELFIRPGDTFSREALIRSQREVWVLNYFADVRPDVRPLDEEKVDILIDVEEKSTDTANMSAGWSERDKLIGSVGVSMNNFLGNGQRLSADVNVGSGFRSYQFSFTEPWLYGSPTLVGLSLFNTRRDARFVNYGTRSRGGSVRVGKRLKWPDDFFRTEWVYRIQELEFFDLDPDLQDDPRFESFTQSSLTHVLTRNSLNRPEFPTSGSRVSLTTEVSGGPLLGSADFHKHQLQMDWFIPFLGPLVLFTNMQAGYLNSFSSNDEIPFTEFFFMGGEGLTNSISLRGYDDPLRNTNPAAGKAYLKYQSELRIQISPSPTIYGLTFAEAGNTWSDLNQLDPYDLRRSVGVGVRLFMPLLGVIGFDYAYSFDDAPGVSRTSNPTRGWKPHFVFGRSF